MVRRPSLRPVQGREVDPRLAVASLLHEIVLRELPRERPCDDLLLHLEERGGGLDQRFAFGRAVSLAGDLLQHVADSGPCAGDRVGVEPDRLRNRVRGAKADSADVEGKPVRVLPHPVHRLVSVEPVDPDRPGGAHPVRLEKDHDLADRLLLRPGAHHLGLALGPDSGQLQQPIRIVLDDFEDVRPERADELCGEVGTDAPDHPRAEVLFDAFEGGRRNHPEVLRPELEAVAPVVDPHAVRLDELAGPDRCGGSDHRDRLAPPRGVHPQHAEPGLLVVERDAFDGAGYPLRISEVELESVTAVPAGPSPGLGHGVSSRVAGAVRRSYLAMPALAPATTVLSRRPVRPAGMNR